MLQAKVRPRAWLPARSQAMTLPLSVPDTTVRPVGSTATWVRPPDWETKVWTIEPEERSQTRTSPSRDPPTRLLPSGVYCSVAIQVESGTPCRRCCLPVDRSRSDEGRGRSGVRRGVEADGGLAAIRGERETAPDRELAGDLSGAGVPQVGRAVLGRCHEGAVRGEGDLHLFLAGSDRVGPLPSHRAGGRIEEDEPLGYRRASVGRPVRQPDRQVASRRARRRGSSSRWEWYSPDRASSRSAGRASKPHRSRRPATGRPGRGDRHRATVGQRSAGRGWHRRGQLDGGPVGFHVRRSSKRTAPAASPVAMSCPLGLMAIPVISLVDGRMKRSAAGLRCKAASRSPRVSVTFSSLTPATASNIDRSRFGSVWASVPTRSRRTPAPGPGRSSGPIGRDRVGPGRTTRPRPRPQENRRSR